MVVEKRTFINQLKYKELKSYFEENSKEKKDFNQIIYKYKSDVDFRFVFDHELAFLRLRGSFYASDDLVVPVALKDVKTMKLLLKSLGMHIDIKWFRHRAIYQYQNYTVTLDETYHYGYVVSIAKEISNIKEQPTAYEELEQVFRQLQIPITTKEQFNDRYKFYKISWVDVANKIDEDHFLQN